MFRITARKGEWANGVGENASSRTFNCGNDCPFLESARPPRANRFAHSLIRPLALSLAISLLSVSMWTDRSTAQETEQSAGPHQLMFLPPPVEGTISVGVYDNRGKLVRVVKKGADIDSFKSGLNGLLIDWDGNGDDGKPVAQGKYFARGVLVGSAKVAGVAFHLNDWATPDSSTHISRILSVALLPGKTIAALVGEGGAELLIVNADKNETKKFGLGSKLSRLKSDGERLFGLGTDGLIDVDAATGTCTNALSAPGLLDADQFNTRTIAVTNSAIYLRSNGTEQNVANDMEITRCALLSNTAVLASEQGKFWQISNDQVKPLEGIAPGEVFDLAAGKNDTVWLLIQSSGTLTLRQIDLSGNAIQEFALPADLQSVRHFSANRADDTLLLEADEPGRQRTLGIQFVDSHSAQSVWGKWFERELTNFQYFDVRDGKVVPTSNKSYSTPVAVRPENNPLDNTRQANFQLVAAQQPDGVWIETVDGLPLLPVSQNTKSVQIKWVPDGTSAMRIFVSDGSVVEEFRASGLQDLYRFDAGAF
jgi:hypothetical protein